MCEDHRIFINGVAGSRKTDTLIKLSYKLLSRGLNVLIITLVGSVTVEIRDRLQELIGATFVRTGSHYLLNHPENNATVEIANYDAFIHKQLQVCGEKTLCQQYGDCFHEKVQILYDKYVADGTHNKFYMCNNTIADALFMDEFQDIEPLKARVLTDMINMSDSTEKMYAVAAGDFLQSIFDHAIQPDDLHPMDVWRKELSPRMFTLNKCFRCPRSHVGLANAVLAPYYTKYGLPEMVPHSTDDDHEPVIMLCPPFTQNNLSSIIAIQVRKVIDTLFDIDPDIFPADIAIIMGRTNANPVFKQLEYELSDLYLRRGFGSDAIKVFETRGDGYSMSIDWAKAQNRTVMLSIHGDKGKGHKVVFFLGCSEGCIPKDVRLFTEKSLVDESLMNVALTRSTRWLFIGVTQQKPSRFIRDVPDITKHAVLSWNPETWTRGWHHTVCQSMNDNVWTSVLHDPTPQYPERFYLSTKIIAPDKFRIRVKDDIAHTFEHPKVLAPMYPWKHVEVTRFGHKIQSFSISDDQLPLWGTMCELIFSCDDFLSLLRQQQACVYTDNHTVLNVVQDEGLNRILMNDPSGMMYHVVLSRIVKDNHAGQAGAFFSELATHQAPKFVVPSVLKRYLNVSHGNDSDNDNDAVSGNTYWNLAIMYEMVFSPLRNPVIHKEFDRFKSNDRFDKDVQKIKENAEAFKAILNEKIVNVHRSYSLHTIENDPNVLEEMGVIDRKSATLGIDGVSDFETEFGVYEIKAPVGQKFNNRWVIQPLMYSCMRPETTREIGVIDLTNGVLYKYSKIDSNVNKKSIIKKVLTKFGHRHEHIARLLGKR